MSKTLPDGFVAFRKMFGGDDKMPNATLNQLTLTLHTELYIPILDQHSNDVDAERKTVYLSMLVEAGRQRENVYTRNLKARGVVAPSMSWPRSVSRKVCKCKSVLKVKSHDGSVLIRSHRVLASQCLHQEHLVVESPRMPFYLPVEQSVDIDDCKQLSHAFFKKPASNGGKVKMTSELKELVADIYKHYPAGIHGAARQQLTSNRLICYRMLRECLEQCRTSKSPINPDFIYYALYRMFPRSGSQEDFATMFPDLCKSFAEPGFNAYALESWKSPPEPRIAVNLRNVKCHDCLHYVCAVHGFRAEVPALYRDGNFLPVRLPLPPRNLSSSFSSEDVCPCDEDGLCWKTTSMRRIRRKLAVTDEDIDKGFVNVFFDIKRLVEIPEERGSSMLTFMPSMGVSFCDFVKCYVDDHHYAQITSCRAAYYLALDNLAFPDDLEAALCEPTRVLPYRERLQNFRKTKLRQEKEARKAAGLKEPEHDHEHENKEPIQMRVVTPYKPCNHAGPCSTAEDCVCRANGTCFHGCQCSDNCPQKFPGCNCAPGKCDTRVCPCHRAQWECSPLTCKNCGCADVDSEFGADTSCKNFGMTRQVVKRLQVRQSNVSGAGNGLFAGEPIKKNELVVEYVGERISEEEVERRGVRVDHKKCSYIFNLQGGGGIDAERIGNVSRFANHNHKNPNLFSKNVVVNGESRIGLYAKRDLEVGEELTFDYNYSKKQREAYFGQ